MPKYQVVAPDGRKVVLEGEAPPTDADLDQIFASLPPPATETPTPGSSSSLGLQSAAQAIPLAQRAVTSALSSPDAPRVIQRGIQAGVRGAAGAAGAAVGGVPGAIVGATASAGLTPTQQTIRGWLGARSSAGTVGDGVTNYVKSMAGNVENLGPAARNYTTEMGRQFLYDASGKARLVPSEAAAAATPPVSASTPLAKFLGTVSKGLSLASGAQGVLDLAQMADPNRRDIGFLGMGASIPDLDVLQAAVKKGANPVQASAQIAKGDVQRFAQLMKDYLGTQQTAP